MTRFLDPKFWICPSKQGLGFGSRTQVPTGERRRRRGGDAKRWIDRVTSWVRPTAANGANCNRGGASLGLSLSQSATVHNLRKAISRGVLFAGGDLGPPRLRWPPGCWEMYRTEFPSPAEGVRPRSHRFRVRFPTR